MLASGWLQQDLGGGLEAAAAARQLDGPVEVCFGVRELLGQRQRVARFDQHMEAPGLDLFALREWVFDRLGHSSQDRSPCRRRTLPPKVWPQTPLRALSSS